jgi:hypothetical protein
VQDPVLVANLVQCAPPLANAALGLSAHAVASLRLPAEVLASALFNLLDALDAAALARLLDGLSGLLVGAHEGSLIIGRHEPQLRQVLARRMLDVASRLDRDRLGRTAAALAEDVETVLRAGADLLQAEPELLLLGLSSALYTLEAALRGLSHGVERLASLPPATREQLDRELRQGLDRLRQQLRQSPTLAALPGRMVAAALGLARRELDRVDAESAGRALGQGLTAAAELVANRPELLNAALADLDRPQARNALERAVAQLTAGLTARPQLLRALLGPLVSGAQHAALDYLRTLPGRLRRRSR